jgi:hypothetical protein
MLEPGRFVPKLPAPLVRGGTFDLGAESQPHFTLVVF